MQSYKMWWRSGLVEVVKSLPPPPDQKILHHCHHERKLHVSQGRDEQKCVKWFEMIQNEQYNMERKEKKEKTIKRNPPITPSK